MPIDATATERFVRFRDVPPLPWIPKRRGTGRLALATLHRWHSRGAMGRDGMVYKLRATRVGGSLCTTEQWLRMFFDNLAAEPPTLTPTAVGPASQPAWPHAVAAKYLARV